MTSMRQLMTVGAHAMLAGLQWQAPPRTSAERTALSASDLRYHDACPLYCP